MLQPDQQGQQLMEGQGAGELNRHVRHLRVPTIFKKTGNLEMFLRKFEAYLENIGAAPQERVPLLISFLDDEVLASIDRHLDEPGGVSKEGARLGASQQGEACSGTTDNVPGEV